MKKWWWTWVVLASFALAATPPAAGLYDQVFPKLQTAKSVLAEDPAQALLLVEEAQRAFEKGKGELPAVIAQGIERAIQDARLAVVRKSKADLEGRLWVVRGAFAKALYDAFFEAVARGDQAAATTLLDRLAKASARPASLVEKAKARAAATDIAGLRALFEQAYAEAIGKTLELAQDATDRVRAYALVSKAYGLFLIIQDAPRMRAIRPADFIEALSRLAQGDLAGFKQQIEQIRQALVPVVATLPPAPVTGERAGEPKPKAKPAPTPAPAEATARTPPPEPEPKPLPRPQIPEEVKTFRAPAWMPAALQAKVTSRAEALGYAYVSDFLNTVSTVQSDVGAASALLSSVKFEEVRERLDRAWWRYETQLSPIFELLDPGMDRRISLAMERIRRAPGIRSSDLTALYTLLGAQTEHFLNGPPSSGRRFWLNLQAILLGFTGLPRAVMFILAGALALFPLQLIRITFGGRNVYWRLLGLAFFFLLWPAMLEGLTYFSDILANYGGLPSLAVLINLSVLQSLPAQVGWGLSVLLVVVLASWGLRGIALQFGLISDRQRTSAPQEALSPEATSEAEIEWDDEF